MSKTQIKRKPVAPRPGSAYSMKGLDRELWNAFLKRARSEGRTGRWLLEQFIRSYAHGEPLNLEGR